MPTNLDKYKKDLELLIKKGQRLEIGLFKDLGLLDKLANKEEVLKTISPLGFQNSYEGWYTESLVIIKQLMPIRLDDFIKLYKNEKRKDIDHLTYTISDHLLGLITRRNGEIIADGKAAVPKFQQQLKIVIAIEGRFQSSLFEIKQVLQADLYDSELESAKFLNNKGFHRASGVICGVVIEKHLTQVSENHEIAIKKKFPTIADFNDILKEKEVIEVSTWRYIQHLTDIRNLCGHNKDREPKKDEVEELISGTEKLIKTIF